RKLADPFRELLEKEGFTAVSLEQDGDGLRLVTARAGGQALRLMVDTGANVSAFDESGLSKWGGKRLGKVDGDSLGGRVKGNEVHIRGLTFGEYDTRQAFSVVNGMGVDLTGINKALVEQKR